LSVVDRVPKLAKLIGDGLQPLAVDADLRVTLDGVAELRVKGVDVGVNIVLE
jgi:ethanolamine ammonia-lyase small subunit